MDKLLLADPSEDFCALITPLLSRKFHVTCSQNGQEVLELLLNQSFDALALSVELPYLDGLSILRQTASHKPPVVLALTRSSHPYVYQQVQELGAAHVLLHPCPADAILYHLEHIREHLHKPAVLTPTERIQRHLRILEIPDDRPGFHHLQVSALLFAQAPEQSLTKELYPAAAALCGKETGGQIAKSMERTIKDTWAVRNEAVWKQYFPPKKGAPVRCPTNRVFLAGVAKQLNQELND